MIIRFTGRTYTPDDTVTSGVARRLLQVSQTTFYRMSVDGHIPCTERMLSRVERLYKVSDLIEFARKRKMPLDTTYLREKEASTNA